VLVFDLPSAVEFADLQGGIDYNRAIVKSFDYGWVSFLENKLHIAHGPRRNSSETSNFFPYVNVLSVWQICQTLLFAASGLVGKSFH
jgi:hypothetical protein